MIHTDTHDPIAKLQKNRHVLIAVVAVLIAVCSLYVAFFIWQLANGKWDESSSLGLVPLVLMTGIVLIDIGMIHSISKKIAAAQKPRLNNTEPN